MNNDKGIVPGDSQQLPSCGGFLNSSLLPVCRLLCLFGFGIGFATAGFRGPSWGAAAAKAARILAILTPRSSEPSISSVIIDLDCSGTNYVGI
jgi:hypothetical protein